VTTVEYDGSSVTVTVDAAGVKRQLRADHLVLSMSPLSIAGITAKPGWPAGKAFALANTRVGIHSRVLLETRTPFWRGDVPSINLQSGNPRMGSVCETAEDVPGERRLLFGTGQAVQTPEETIAAFRSFYPGKAKDTIERCIVHQWWKEEPTCVGCEREPFALGQFARIWPHLLEPVGRVHFVGAAYDSLWRGMEAATRSAERAAQTIHLA
jgi:monoamine oxidase